ncbi:Golgi reassembly-stacking protein 2 isoform X2 [Coccinella septempunctata]|uniref:Golgi reassembly-stacking protein 2 isoform X2 n=1 Tax=Coccinella septempunctata TaxID=41139 RepID=UPI001D07C4F1|nr:Golgi reassembly-stacking protein 2 isoform X2 [Coccinella septempunctata]
MGNSESVDIPGGGSEGYHVLRVQENSPGSRAGLQPFFDFIVAVNGVRLDKDNDALKQILKNGKRLPLTIYSSKTQSVRSVTIEPSDSWGGQGLLGVSIRFCSFEGSNENVWHVLEVHPNSPALIAGLQHFTDYIIGADSVLHESEDLYALIENHEGKKLKLYVYNSNDDSCREITIIPNRNWGGEGLLGCGIGYGYLHRIPVRGSSSVTTIDNTYSYIEPSVSYSSGQLKGECPTIKSEPQVYGTHAIADGKINDASNIISVPSRDNQLPDAVNENPYRIKSNNFTSDLPPPSSIPATLKLQNVTNLQAPCTAIRSMVSTTSSLPVMNKGTLIDTVHSQLNAVHMYTVNDGGSNSTIDSFPSIPVIMPSALPLPQTAVDANVENVDGDVSQQHFFFNHEIAAQSAQQLLQNNPNFQIS